MLISITWKGGFPNAVGDCCCFFILKNFNPTVSYILSVSASSGLIALLSTGSKEMDTVISKACIKWVVFCIL
uniref:Uncharacterized protein n=1 Tax=Xenopus tropicalis TaxID=8364 RepID=A0A6I8SM95_XENTR